jgi:preprotein translocase subunit YajC
MQTLLLQAAGFNPALLQILFMGGIVLVFYFFMIRPQQKKQQDTKKFIDAIKKGDEVITIGGMHGKVSAISDSTITLEVNNNGTKMTFEKSSIARGAGQAA